MGLTTVFQENQMTTSSKVNGLNELEGQAATGKTYIDNFLHDDRYFTQSYCNATFYRTPSHPLGRNDGPGSGLDALTVDGYSLAQIQAMAISSGIIAIWAKSAASTPDAWLLMDGTNGTLDTRGRLLLCAGGSFFPGTTGGSPSVTPYTSGFDTNSCTLADNEIPQHQHTYTDHYCLTSTYQCMYITVVQTLPKADGSTDQTTWGINGQTNMARAGHVHTANSCTFTGYYDQNGVLQTGALLLLPACSAYCWVLKS